jgi:hypothetical protein
VVLPPTPASRSATAAAPCASTLSTWGWALLIGFFIFNGAVRQIVRDNLDSGPHRFAAYAGMIFAFINVLGWWLSWVRKEGIWVTAVVLIAGGAMYSSMVEENLVRGFPRLLGYKLGFFYILNLAAWWWWGTVRDRRARASALASGSGLSRRTHAEEVRRVRGPAIGLIVIGSLSSLALVAAVITAFGLEPGGGIPALVPVLLAGFGLVGTLILIGGVTLLVTPRTRIAGQVAAILALLPLHPLFLFGLPVGVWTLQRLRSLDEEDRLAFRELGNRSSVVKPAVPGVSALAGDSRWASPR